MTEPQSPMGLAVVTGASGHVGSNLVRQLVAMQSQQLKEARDAINGTADGGSGGIAIILILILRLQLASSSIMF